MEQITSRTNALMTHIRKLGNSRSYRQKTGEYVGDGGKLLEEALRWGADITAVVAVSGTALPPLPAAVRQVEVSEELMRSISPMETPQGVLFTAKRPAAALPECLTGRRYLVMEGVQDPGNVGTVLRTADAFEADGVILLEGCADLWSPKTVRASMGAVFRRPVWSTELALLLPLLVHLFDRDAQQLEAPAAQRTCLCAALIECQHSLAARQGRGCSLLPRQQQERCNQLVTRSCACLSTRR